MIADTWSAKRVGYGRSSELRQAASGQDRQRAAHRVAGQEEGLVLGLCQDRFELAPSASQRGAEAVMDPACVFVARDEPDDDIRQPIGKRHGVGAAKGKHSVGVADAEIPSGARELVAECDRLEAEPLPGRGGRGAEIGDVGGVGQVERVGPIERNIVRIKRQRFAALRSFTCHTIDVPGYGTVS